jgi:hypothetical protein
VGTLAATELEMTQIVQVDRTLLKALVLEELARFNLRSREGYHHSFGETLPRYLRKETENLFSIVGKLALAPCPMHENDLAAKVFICLVGSFIDRSFIVRDNYRDLSGVKFDLGGKYYGLPFTICGFNIPSHKFSTDDGSNRLNRAGRFLDFVTDSLNQEVEDGHVYFLNEPKLMSFTEEEIQASKALQALNPL